MMTTSGCRAQSTAWRQRFLRGMLGWITGSACMYLAAAPGVGRTEPLTRWSGPVPPLSLPTLDGPLLALEVPPGDLLIVHFFATWCETCGPELQALDRLAADLETSVSIVAIDVAEPTDRIRRYFQKFPVRFRIALDTDRAAARAWGVVALPSTFVLDRSLAPVWQATGDVAWNDPTVRRHLLSATSSPPAGGTP
ncbi:MAG: TlpA family protein disulfide reductase [Hyphomicrobiaceae bacterium]